MDDCTCFVPSFRNDCFVVVDRNLRGHARVGPAVDKQEFTAAREKLTEIRIDGVDWSDIGTISH
jgi:hypothetical protein